MTDVAAVGPAVKVAAQLGGHVFAQFDGEVGDAAGGIDAVGFQGIGGAFVDAFGAGPNGIYEGSKDLLFQYVNCYGDEYAVPEGIMQLAEIREEHEQYEAREHEALRVKDALKTFYLSKQAYIQNKN